MKLQFILIIIVILGCESPKVSYQDFHKIKDPNLPEIGLTDIDKFSFQHIKDSLNFPFCDSTFNYYLKFSTNKSIKVTTFPPTGHCLEILDRNTIKILINAEGEFMIEYTRIEEDELGNEIINLSNKLNRQGKDYHFVIKYSQTQTALNSLIIALDLINKEFYKGYLKQVPINKSGQSVEVIVNPS